MERIAHNMQTKWKIKCNVQTKGTFIRSHIGRVVFDEIIQLPVTIAAACW